jgi:hypothetical protein
LKTHQQWSEAVKRALAGTDKAQTARRLEEIARGIAESEDTGFSPWHLVQTLGFAAGAFEDAGNLGEAERVLRECFEVTHNQLVQASRSHAEVASQLGALLFQTSAHEEASRVASIALHALAFAPEPCLAIERFLTAWRVDAASRRTVV